jgi:hypothetical protein
MKAIYFIEKDGVKSYKADSFWSTTKKVEYAKTHTDSVDDQKRFFESYLSSMCISKEGDTDFIMSRQGLIYGFDIIDNGYNILETIYLKIISKIEIIDEKKGHLGSLSKFNLNLEIEDYKLFIRNEKINNILK